MPSRAQNRAGREVAEDAKRAVRRAIRFVGLEEHEVRMVLGGGKPEGWPYELPPSVEALVTTTG